MRVKTLFNIVTVGPLAEYVVLSNSTSDGFIDKTSLP